VEKPELMSGKLLGRKVEEHGVDERKIIRRKGGS
jgi:hypothetical protein